MVLQLKKWHTGAACPLKLTGFMPALKTIPLQLYIRLLIDSATDLQFQQGKVPFVVRKLQLPGIQAHIRRQTHRVTAFTCQFS